MAMPMIAARVIPPKSAIFMANRLACAFLEFCIMRTYAPTHGMN
jgi:hypothetical protein